VCPPEAFGGFRAAELQWQLRLVAANTQMVVLDEVVLTSGSTLTAGIFWAGAAVVVAILAIVVSIILWALGSPRRLLVYNLDSDTALFSGDARKRVGADLEVTVGGRVIADPHVVSFRVESRGRRDIRPDDFTHERALIFDLTAPVLKLLEIDTIPDYRALLNKEQAGDKGGSVDRWGCDCDLSTSCAS
jgi:hypothetical protein